MTSTQGTSKDGAPDGRPEASRRWIWDVDGLERTTANPLPSLAASVFIWTLGSSIVVSWRSLHCPVRLRSPVWMDTPPPTISLHTVSVAFADDAVASSFWCDGTQGVSRRFCWASGSSATTRPLSALVA